MAKPTHLILLSGIYPTDSVSFTRPIACYQLKHWLQQFGIESQVIEFCSLLSLADLKILVDRFVGPETFALGLSTSFWKTDSIPPNVEALIDHVRTRHPKLKIVAGGGRTPKKNLFDKVFAGEAEDQFTVWCQEQLGKSGRAFFNRKHDITQNAHRFDERDCILEKEMLPIELGRGCIFKCKFCAHHNLGKDKHTYQRQHQLIMEEMRYNFQAFGTTNYLFLDDTVNEDQDKVERLAQLPEDLGFQPHWVGYLRADLIWSKKNSAKLLEQSGLKSCLFGVETFNLEAGKSIDKAWGAKHGKAYLPQLYEDLWGKRINIHLSLIAGLPGETFDSLDETVAWCHQNQIGYHLMNPIALYVNRQDTQIQSEFTRNHGQYGYRKVDTNGYWETDQMNSKDCAMYCEHANRRFQTQNRITCWGLAGVFNLLKAKASLTELMKMPSLNVPYLIGRNGPIFKKAYMHKLLTLNA